MWNRFKVFFILSFGFIYIMKYTFHLMCDDAMEWLK